MSSSRKGPGFYGRRAAVPLPFLFSRLEKSFSGKGAGQGCSGSQGLVEDWILGCKGQNSKVFLPKGEGGAGAVPLGHKHIPQEEMGKKSCGEIPGKWDFSGATWAEQMSHKSHRQLRCDSLASPGVWKRELFGREGAEGGLQGSPRDHLLHMGPGEGDGQAGRAWRTRKYKARE